MKHSKILPILALTLMIMPVWGTFSVSAETEIIVSAAASLTKAFTELGKAFEEAHPESKIIFNFAASGALLQQLQSGAPVDVFATADRKTMDLAEEKDLIVSSTRKDFATNALVLIVPKGSPLAVNSPIKSLKDLELKEIKTISMGNPETVPGGRYAQEALKDAELWEILHPKFIFGNSVPQVLDYVSRGEVDTGFVFATDAPFAGEKVAVVLDVRTRSPIRYPLALVRTSEKKKLAGRFVDFVLSEPGLKTLSLYGFGRP